MTYFYVWNQEPPPVNAYVKATNWNSAITKVFKEQFGGIPPLSAEENIAIHKVNGVCAA